MEGNIKLFELAKKELKTDVGDFGGYIDPEKLYYPSNMMVVISTIVSRYYTDENNREKIDEFIKLCERKLLSGKFGVVSLQYALSNLVDELEKLIVELNKR
ncbi:hypothetical protein ETC00_19000 [Brevibacillus sp. MCWH]|nr:hypothetical protein [Brevibacillus sp. MCWH]